SPFLPLIGGGETRFQPVFVGDVAEFIARGVDGALSGGDYELGGPEVKSFRELIEFVLKTTGRRRLTPAIPWPAAFAMAQNGQLLPGSPLTFDQVRLLRTDVVVSQQAKEEGRTLEGVGISPRALEAIMPAYLWRFRKAGQFTRLAA